MPMPMHNEWYQTFKSAYSLGKKKAIDEVISKLGVKRRHVEAACNLEQWEERVKTEQEAAEDRLDVFLRKVRSHQAHHESVGFQGAKIANAQLKLHDRLQKLLDDRFSRIERADFDDEHREAFTIATIKMMGEASRSLQSTITAVDKSRSIASEALQITEMIEKTEQLELKLF
jgi:hypothetical protein